MAANGNSKFPGSNLSFNKDRLKLITYIESVLPDPSVVNLVSSGDNNNCLYCPYMALLGESFN